MPTPIPSHTTSSRLLIGAMSGTSADGVDAALVEITGRGLDMQVKYLGHVERPYDAELRKRIFALRESGACRLDELARLGREITLAYAAAVRELLGQQGVEASQVQAVAAHGQTLYHEVPDTIQWLDPSLLAAQTGIAVVSDFRRADLAAGGQGAPLVPFADWILFRHPEKTRVILNIGGIANLTYLPAGGGIDEVIAFDTGPGNCISDWLMRTYEPDGPGYDEGGVRAARGRGGIRSVREAATGDPYYRRQPPKSTDTFEMIEMFRNACRSSGEVSIEQADAEKLNRLLATATDIVTSYLWRSLDWLGGCDELIIGGGGAKNGYLLGSIRNVVNLGPKEMYPADDLGLPSQARESVAFAVMGAATLDGEPSNVPSATGAKKRVVLGSITPRP